MREKLALFQTGQSAAGEQEPFFLAGQIIEKARSKSDAKDRLSTVKEVGLVVLAQRLTAQGVRATTKAKMMSAIKTELPKVDYPGDEPLTEAAEKNKVRYVPKGELAARSKKAPALTLPAGGANAPGSFLVRTSGYD